jgi:ribosomal-protein-alanine N-acetyltransferase
MRWWHLEHVLSLEHDAFAGSAWTPEQLWSELAQVSRGRHYVVACTPDGAVAGYAGLAVTGDSADVMTVAVATGLRRGGLGRALVVDLLEHAADQGVHEVLLEVAADNTAAQALYDSVGFTRLSRRRDYYGAGRDGVVMLRRGRWVSS